MKKLLAVIVLLGAAIPAAVAQPSGGGGPMERLRSLDLNQDGAITKAEARAGRETAFRALDANSDGFVTEAEKQARREEAAKKRADRGGGGNDANGDGKISRAEFVDAPYRMFDRLDANNNDILDASELEMARTMMLQRKQGTP